MSYYLNVQIISAILSLLTILNHVCFWPLHRPFPHKNQLQHHTNTISCMMSIFIYNIYFRIFSSIFHFPAYLFYRFPIISRMEYLLCSLKTE